MHDFFFRIEMKDGNGLTYVSMLEQISNQLNPSLILCVLQTNRNDIYHNIKRKLCVDRASKLKLLKKYIMFVFVSHIVNFPKTRRIIIII